MRPWSVVLLVALAAAALPASADASLFFLFNQTTAAPNDRVTVRTGSTPRNFRPRPGARLGRPVRLYLVPTELADDVHSRFDPRLQFVGSLASDARGRGSLTFSVPPLDPGSYDVAYWCPACARYSKLTFVVQRGDKFIERYKSEARLRIATTQTCPVTIPNSDVPRGYHGSGWTFHGNRALAASVPPNGVYVHEERGGAIGAKIIWIAGGVNGSLRVSYRRIDVAGAIFEARTGRGTLSGFDGPSWASQMSFTEGCWKVVGRIRDVSLTFVMRVARP